MDQKNFNKAREICLSESEGQKRNYKPISEIRPGVDRLVWLGFEPVKITGKSFGDEEDTITVVHPETGQSEKISYPKGAELEVKTSTTAEIRQERIRSSFVTDQERIEEMVKDMLLQRCSPFNGGFGRH